MGGFWIMVDGTKFELWKHRRFDSVQTIGQWSKVYGSVLLVEK